MAVMKVPAAMSWLCGEVLLDPGIYLVMASSPTDIRPLMSEVMQGLLGRADGRCYFTNGSERVDVGDGSIRFRTARSKSGRGMSLHGLVLVDEQNWTPAQREYVLSNAAPGMLPGARLVYAVS